MWQKCIHRSHMENGLPGRHLFSFETLFLLLIIVVYAMTQEEAGDWCLSEEGDDGICRHLRHCPPLQRKTYVYNGGGATIPGLCSYGSNGPIVCCPTREETPGSEAAPEKKGVKPPSQPTYLEGEIDVASPDNGDSSIDDAGLRVNERKCQEYARSVSQSNYFQSGDKGEWCPLSPNGLIVGGRNAESGEYPHMAALGYLQKTGLVQWLCSGSLISESFVLTAAHCTGGDNGRLIAIHLGDLLLRPLSAVMLRLALSKQSDEASGIHAVADIIRHPEYSSFAYYNDIALIRLAKPIQKFSLNVRPACLYTVPDVSDNIKAVATGFGLTNADDTSDFKLLRLVDLKIHELELCNTLYSVVRTTSRLSKGIIDSMMCAGELSGGKDTCEGDSGGPLQVRDLRDKCIFNIVGVLALGPNSCGAPNTLAVYTKVSTFLSWIESVVWPDL